MVTFSVALLVILIGLSASSVHSDEQQNQNKTENGGGGLKHLFGFDGSAFPLISLLSSNSRLVKQIEIGIRENLNALAEKMWGIEAKLENQIEHGKRDNQNELTTKIENGIGGDNQNALSLMKNIATSTLCHSHLPIYHRWNATDCHPKIVINESTNAIQRNETDESLGYCSCRAEPIQMSSSADRIGIIYTEYRTLNNGLFLLFIGLSTKEVPLDYVVGYIRISYGYENYGQIDYKKAKGKQAIISDNVPSFGTGDVVGCGLNWATRQVFFTKNGQRLNITNLYVDEGTTDFFPTVTLFDHLAAVEANFGPNFKYDLSKEF